MEDWKVYGYIARTYGRKSLMLCVIQSGNCFIIGTQAPGSSAVFSRESEECFPDMEAATEAFSSGNWSQRQI